MLRLKKILSAPSITSCLLATMSFNITSCSKVYNDLIQDPIKPKDKAWEDQHFGDDFEAATKYYFSQIGTLGSKKILEDIYSSASDIAAKKYESREMDGEVGSFSYTKFLMHLSNVTFDGQGQDPETNKVIFFISYEISGKVESLLDNIGQDKLSYRKDWYTFNISIKHVPYSFKKIKFPFEDNELIYMTPYRFSFDGETSKAEWTHFYDQEKISYTCRHACEGFTKNGLQNYAYEAEEQALIDSNHDYEPKFEIQFTSLFIYSSYYMRWLND